MRILVLYLLFVFVSCKSNTEKEKLLGSWTTEQDESKYPKNGISDRLTFFANDSFKVEMYLSQKMSESFSGKYTFDEKSKLLTIVVGPVKTQSEIIELTTNRLLIKQENTKTISNYKRL
jgi:hypothetical protein